MTSQTNSGHTEFPQYLGTARRYVQSSSLTIIINLYEKMDITTCVFGGCGSSLIMVHGSSHQSEMWRDD